MSEIEKLWSGQSPVQEHFDKLAEVVNKQDQEEKPTSEETKEDVK